jgi:fatty-acyl-CoA synthase
MPAIDVPNLLCCEDLIGGQSEEYAWPEFDERSACLPCYTSGITGNPKDVLDAHRLTVPHSLMECAPDTFGACSSMCILLALPCFTPMPAACPMRPR